MNFLVLSLTCVFCKSAVCHRNLRMLAAAVSGTGLEAFGLMVLPYAISVLCTACLLYTSEIWSKERYLENNDFDDMDEIAEHMAELGIGI